MTNELSHHGILGQKWGVRRYQNPDGSLTPLGQSRYRAQKAARTKDDVDEIISTMSSKDKKFLEVENGYLTIEQGEHVIKRILEKNGDTPIGFIDFLKDGNNLNVAIGVRGGEEYRNKGYATKLAKRGMKWCDEHPEMWDQVIWGVVKGNDASAKVAKKAGFKLTGEYKNYDTYKYYKRTKHNN